MNLKKNKNYNHSVEEKITKFGIIGSRQVNSNGNWQPHKNATSIKADLGETMFNKYYKFSVVRNPYDKMVSYYHWKGNKITKNLKEDFKKFCKENTCNNMYIHSINGKPICDYYIRFEYLFEDIEKVCLRLGIKNFKPIILPTFKSEYRTERIPYQEYYDEECKKIVYEKNKREIEYFNYKF